MLELNFSPFPTLTTVRLALRQVNMDDLQDLLFLRTDDAVMRYIDRPKPKSELEVVELIQKITDGINNNTAIGWAVCLQDELKMIGTVSYHNIDREHYRGELGYVLKPEHWGKGIISEAITQVLHYGFHDMKLHSVMAIVNPENVQSINVLIKQGFVQEGYFKEDFFFNGKFLDSAYYSLLTPVKAEG